MQALWLEKKELRHTEAPVPEASHGEALVRVSLSGICQTDLELCSGYYPFTGILGHEFVGIVESVNSARSVDTAWIGKRVVAAINTSCATPPHGSACSTCTRSLSDLTHCKDRTVLGIKSREGCHAEYLTMPVANLVEVPPSVPDEAAVFAEPLAAALQVQQQAAFRPTDRVLVIGAGRLGLLCALTLALLPARLTVCARHDRQRRFLEERKIQHITEEELSRPEYSDHFDVVVEATGSPSGLAAALRVTIPRGRIVLKSTYAISSSAASPAVNLSSIVVKELSVIGSRCGPMDAAIALLASGRVDPTGLIDAIFPLAEATKAMERAAQKGVLKVLIRPGKAASATDNGPVGADAVPPSVKKE